MSEYSFTATSRIPTRPLSYDNKDLAEAKEILVDYNSHEIYVCGINGQIVNVTASVTKVVQEVITQIEKDSTIIGESTIELPDGTSVILNEALLKAIVDIEELQESLGLIKDEETGNIILKIPAADVVTDNNKQFVTAEEKRTWNNKTDTIQITASIPAGEDMWTSTDGEAPYTQKVIVTDIKETDYPVVDVRLSDIYADAMEELNNYAYIYKILTYDGYIMVYAGEPTERALNIIMKVDR